MTEMFCALPQSNAFKAFDKIYRAATFRNTPIVLVRISYFGTVCVSKTMCVLIMYAHDICLRASISKIE